MTQADQPDAGPAAAARAAPAADGRAGLWLVRHARPLIDPGVCYGATDVAVDPQHNEEAARMLARALGPHATLHCSPLRRCTELADALCGLRPDLQWRRDARIAEMDFGCWEGIAWAAIPRPELDRWSAEFATLRFGGAESVQQMMDRVRAAWNDCLGAAGSHVWLTHAGVIRCATLLSRGVHTVTDARQWPNEPLAFGSLRRVL